MAGQRRSQKRRSRSNTVRNTLLLGGAYAVGGALARYGYNTAKGNKQLRTSINKIKGAAKKVGVISKKSGRWKSAHGKTYKLIGKNGGKVTVSRRGLSSIASTVKRRRSSTAAWRKTTIKAGPAARSAFKKAPRNVVRGKVRSPSYAIIKRRR